MTPNVNAGIARVILHPRIKVARLLFRPGMAAGLVPGRTDNSFDDFFLPVIQLTIRQRLLHIDCTRLIRHSQRVRQFFNLMTGA